MSVLRVRKTFLAGGGFPLVLAKCSWLAHGAGYPRKHTSDRVRIWAFSQFLSRSAEAKLGHSMLPIVCCVFPIWLSGIFCCGSKSRALICSKLVWHVLLCLLGWFNLWNSCKCSVLLLFWVYLTCLDSLDSIKHRSSTGITISNIYIYNMVCVVCVCLIFQVSKKSNSVVRLRVIVQLSKLVVLLNCYDQGATSLSSGHSWSKAGGLDWWLYGLDGGNDHQSHQKRLGRGGNVQVFSCSMTFWYALVGCLKLCSVCVEEMDRKLLFFLCCLPDAQWPQPWLIG